MQKGRFVRKMLIIYSLIIVLGLGVSSFFVANTMAEQMIETKTKYEKERMNRLKADTNNRLETISNIFTNMYLKEYGYRSIIDVLLEDLDEYQRGVFVNQYLRASSNSTRYIGEIMLVDYLRNEKYLVSKRTYQDWDKIIDLKNTKMLQEIKAHKNEIIITPRYHTDYLKNNQDTMSVYLNLVDVLSREKNKTFGAVIVNIEPDSFFDIYGNTEEEETGVTYVINREGDICYQNGDKNYEWVLEKEELTKQEQKQYIVEKEELKEWSGLSYVHIMDKSVMYGEVYRITLRQVLPIMIICLMLCLLGGILIAAVLSNRIGRIVRHIQVIQRGNLGEQMEVTKDDEIAVLEKGLNNMSSQLKEYIDTIFVKDLKMKKAKLRSLQIQINPHFMFNTLEAIRSLAISHQDFQTAQMLTLLGQMFRWNLRSPDIVLIEDELEYVDYYMQLQELRFEGRLEYMECLPKYLKEIKVPKLSLQPIIENCINHAFHQDMESCRIVIEGEVREGKSMIYIRDNGIGMDQVTTKMLQSKIEMESEEENLYHIGIKNVNQRIRLLLGDEFGIRIVSVTMEGTSVILDLPADK